MGNKHDRAIEKLRKNPRNVRFDEIDAILIHLGFTKRMKGSHATYTYPGLRPMTIPFRKPFILPVYVEQVVQMIEQIESEDD